MKSRYTTYGILGCVFLLDLIWIAIGKEEYRWMTKTLLMPILAILYSRETKYKVDLQFLLGLTFSFLGDVFLLFHWGFLAGLGSFFMAHVVYCVVFFKRKIRRPSLLVTAVLLMYTMVLIQYLFPFLGEMKIPVMAYAGILATMVYASIATQRRCLMIGGVLFAISDSLLSWNLFVSNHLLVALGVMVTYVFAQFFLVRGMLRN